MKKRQEVRWTESAGSNRHEENSFEKYKSAVAEALLSAVCVLIFLYSAYDMLQEVYQWDGLDAGFFWRLFFFAVLVSAVMELRVPERKVLTCALHWGVLFLGSAGYYGYLRYGSETERIFSGIQAAAADYVIRWNAYYGTIFWVPAGDSEEIAFALNFMMFFLCFFLTWGVKMLQRNSLPVLIPLLVLLSGFLIGDSPEGAGLFAIFAGILSANALHFRLPDFGPAKGGRGQVLDGKKAVSFLLGGAALFLACGVVQRIGTPLAEATVTEHSGSLKQLQREVLNQGVNWTFWENIEFFESLGDVVGNVFEKKDANTAKLTNNSPNYQDIPVLRMKAEKLPLENLYLKGFCAGEYENGAWHRNQKAFDKECKKAGFDSEKVAVEIALFGTKAFEEAAAANQLSEEVLEMAASLFYYDSSGTNAYFPYFAVPEVSGIRAESDNCIRKKKALDEISFMVWNFDGESIKELLQSDGITEPEWEAWYKKYVQEHYLTVAETIPTVRTVAEEIEEWIDERELFGNETNENEMRLVKAYLVAEWMSKNTEYSLQLPQLPFGTDPVEFFLAVSRSGYCMHYASASVMILRELGVPARYVSGYIVNKTSFLFQSGEYEATVPDSREHAWAEIYLDGIGWIPIEVTKGYGNPLSDGTGTVPEPTEKPETPPSDMPGQGSGDMPGNVSAPGPEVPPPEIPGGGMEQPVGPAEIPVLETEQPVKQSKKANFSFRLPPETLVFVVLFRIFFGVFIMPVYVLCKKTAEKADVRRMRRIIRRSGNRQAIKLLNRKVYQKLRLRGKIFKSSLSDAEYEKILKKNYQEILIEDWNNYMKIVKAAAFSCSDFTKEEMRLCYGIYRKIIYNTIAPPILAGVVLEAEGTEPESTR